MAALQSGASVPFTFNGQPLAAISHEDDLWLTGEDIGRALLVGLIVAALTINGIGIPVAVDGWTDGVLVNWISLT